MISTLKEYKDWVYKTPKTGAHFAIACEIIEQNEKELKELKEDVKEMIISAMEYQAKQYDNCLELEDWQKNDIRTWFYEDWVKDYKNN